MVLKRAGINDLITNNYNQLDLKNIQNESEPGLYNAIESNNINNIYVKNS